MSHPSESRVYGALARGHALCAGIDGWWRVKWWEIDTDNYEMKEDDDADTGDYPRASGLG